MSPRTLSSRALTYMIAQLAANAVGFVTSMVLARVFSKEQMGDYQQLMMVYTLFSSVLIAGLPSCLTYFYPIAEEERKGATVYIVLLLLFVMGALLGVLTLAGAPFVAAYFKNVRLNALVKDFFLFYAFTLGGAYIRRFLVATSRYRFLMFWLPMDRVLMLLSFAVPALLGMGLEGAVVVAVWVAGAKFAMTTLYTMTVVPPTGVIWDTSLAVRMLYYSIPIGLSQAVGQISRQIDRLVIGRYTSPEFFATFSWAAQALPFIPEIAESVMTVLIPELAKLHKAGENGKFLAIWQESIRKTSIIILGTFGLVEALAGPIIIMIYSDKYADSVPYFRLYQIGLVLRVTMFGAVLQALGRTRQILYASLFLLAVKAGVNVTLFKIMGPVGPVIGSLVLGLGMMVYYVTFIAGQLGTPAWRIWNWSYYGRTLAAAVLAGAAALLVYLVPQEAIAHALGSLSHWLDGRHSVVSAVQVAIGTAIFAPVYVLILHYSGVLKPKDWQLVKSMTYGRFMK